ncbi:Lrp/AsnC family transcriptional regulator, leucine-responsive regulatory protein [Evansella caseinilytica]|uniref:Lrp/AsnC family transcriptional regulator, leucine-responsive regulatory protein n=1 Tax=Evansella caseinilytica TaxID=1503961 RepID=A0A1H3G5C9_9BACI|nr:Lrp/AsnC family transcriptional regulator [Evansella caseinilytica]SDX97664.1 Lrp/AsnC family transcriptional regulator, leucine-responsive regulatory protein [Evansella caseinilytica]
MTLDDIDKVILKELSKDARISMKDLGDIVNLSSPSVKERISKLKKEGIIKKCTIAVNKEKLGLKISCIVTITISTGKYHHFIEFIENHPQIDFCYRSAGQVCFYILLSVREISEIEQFVDEASKYGTVNTNLVLSQVKTKGYLEYALDE